MFTLAKMYNTYSKVPKLFLSSGGHKIMRAILKDVTNGTSLYMPYPCDLDMMMEESLWIAADFTDEYAYCVSQGFLPDTDRLQISYGAFASQLEVIEDIFVDIDYVYIPYFPATEKNSVKSFCDLIDEMRVGTTCVITVPDYCTFSEKYKKVREKIIHEGMLKQMIRIDGSLLFENVKGDYYILILKKNTCSFLLVSGKRL